MPKSEECVDRIGRHRAEANSEAKGRVRLPDWPKFIILGIGEFTTTCERTPHLYI